jgi:acyl-CoA hydrolase
MEDHIRMCETRQFKVIFPHTLNANGTLFGGQAMYWMDEVAYITATRFTRQRMYTIKAESINFIKAVCPDSIVELVGKVEKAGTVRLIIRVDMFVEEMYGKKREKAMEGIFVFAELNENRKPKRIDYSLINNQDLV